MKVRVDAEQGVPRVQVRQKPWVLAETLRESGPGMESPWLKLCFSCCLGSGDWQAVCGWWGRAGLMSDSRGFPGELWARPLRTELSA